MKQDDHPFFSNLGDGREYFKGLLQESFVPQNISDPEDKTFEEKTESIAQCAREYVIAKRNRKKVFFGGTDDLSHFFLLALMPESNKIFYL